MKYKVVKVRFGEHQEFLNKGYEPFSVAIMDSSYEFRDSLSGRICTEHRSTDYIYLRKMVNTKSLTNH